MPERTTPFQRLIKNIYSQLAEDEVEVMLFEPASTLNTGDKINEITKHKLEKI